MNRKETLEALLNENPEYSKQIYALFNCGSRFCRITMKPQASDIKRNGNVRVYHLNVRATWKNYEKRHFGMTGNLTESVKKMLKTKTRKCMLTIVENARSLPKGGSIQQCRTLVIPMIDTIKCGKSIVKF